VVRRDDLRPKQLEALDDLVELLDEAAVLIRAGKLKEARAKISKAQQKADLIRVVTTRQAS
jgi:hypothetical protein